MNRTQTQAGIAAGRLIYEVLRLHGRLVAAGDALVADIGLSSARWQVLGTVAAAPSRLTVSDLSRILGQSRQSIQRLANEMNEEGLMSFEANPSHKRAMYVRPTEAGRRLHADVESRRIPWTEALAARLDGVNPEQAARALAMLRGILENDLRE